MSGDTLVSVGSPTTTFPQNKQNEPALAVDANHPNVLVAGANDEIDLEAAAAGDPTTAPFTAGVGVSGVYFSFDSGKTWTQPTYTGWTARNQLGPPGTPAVPHVGPIGTLPNYYENGLVSGGDPALAFGPVPGPDGKFSWANGSRLYYANLASNFPSPSGPEAFKGFEAVAVSRTDNVAAAAANDQTAWKAPVIVSKQSSATFSDKEQIWADNAASSPFFGNVYVAYAKFQGVHGNTESIIVAHSTDGGDTWTQKQVTLAANNSQLFGRSGATIRTDSHGEVYVFYLDFGQFQTQGQVGTEMMVRSFDGGDTWTRPQAVENGVVQPGVFDPVEGRPVMDGIAGARVDLAAAPSVDIANGAPLGTDATNEIVMTWADARDGLNHEHAMFIDSTNGGLTWSPPMTIETAGDRPFFTAPAISPNGTDVYVVYNAFTTPYRDNTTAPRILVGVVLHAVIGTGGAPSRFTEQNRGAPGDPRGSSTNSLAAEFLGDYVYAVATRTYGAAVWNDVRNAADCPAIDAYRGSLYTTSPLPRPAPNSDCPPTFGNSDIFGWSNPDPSANPNPLSAVAASSVTDSGFAPFGISPSTAIAPMLILLPDVSPEVQLLTPRPRKRSAPPPALDVQLRSD